MKRIFGLILAGSLLAAAGCVANPLGQGAPGTVQQGADGLIQQGVPLANVDLGLAGSGYSIMAVPVSYTYSEVMFRPELVEVHYAGALSEAEEASEPEDLNGVEAAQTQPAETTQATDATASTVPADGWIKFPVAADFAAFDLMKLGANPLSFGTSPLPVGKYDQIRLSAQSADSQALLTYKATGSDSNAYSGSYFLPSGRLYLSQGFEVREGYQTDLKFAFDVQSAMVQAGGKTILKPGSVKVFANYTAIPAASPDATASAS